ncbi:MAG: RNA polymerase factor sigma-54, partial [Pseudomonadota bacterium]
MKQSIQLKLGQHLTMTPQLQQAIRLLQLSALELNVEIQDALESNMMLEPAEEGADAPDAEASANDSDDAEFEAAFEVGGGDPADQETQAQQHDIPEELPVDSNWDEIYDGMPASAPRSQASEESLGDFERDSSAGESLSEHMMWQLNLTPITENDRVRAIAVIDARHRVGYQ